MTINLKDIHGELRILKDPYNDPAERQIFIDKIDSIAQEAISSDTLGESVTAELTYELEIHQNQKISQLVMRPINVKNILLFQARADVHNINTSPIIDSNDAYRVLAESNKQILKDVWEGDWHSIFTRNQPKKAASDILLLMYISRAIVMKAALIFFSVPLDD